MSMENQKVKISGIENLIKKGVKYNKNSVTVPKENWELIIKIIEKVKFEVSG